MIRRVLIYVSVIATFFACADGKPAFLSKVNQRRSLVEKFFRLSRPSQARSLEETTTDCNVTLEVAFVLDQTVSMNKVLRDLSAEMVALTEEINERFPGTRFGISTFVDKPTATFEGEEDYAWCLLTVAPIGTKPEDLAERLSALSSTGGADSPENSMGAMIRAAHSTELGYSANLTDAKTGGRRTVKVMVLYTDDLPHTADYFSRIMQIQNNPRLKDFVDKGVPLKFADFVTKEALLQKGENYKCAETEYPSFEEWAKTMKKEAIVPVIVAGSFSYKSNGKKYYPLEYHFFAEDMGHINWSDVDKGLYNFWVSILKDYEVDGVVIDLKQQKGAASAKTFRKELRENLLRLPEVVC